MPDSSKIASMEEEIKTLAAEAATLGSHNQSLSQGPGLDGSPPLIARGRKRPPATPHTRAMAWTPLHPPLPVHPFATAQSCSA